MRQRLAIIITVLVVLVILIGLNAASYVKVEQPPDSEQSPDRSTFNSGATGTPRVLRFSARGGLSSHALARTAVISPEVQWTKAGDARHCGPDSRSPHEIRTRRRSTLGW